MLKLVPNHRALGTLATMGMAGARTGTLGSPEGPPLPSKLVASDFTITSRR
jgi:hypothetical protein